MNQQPKDGHGAGDGESTRTGGAPWRRFDAETWIRVVIVAGAVIALAAFWVVNLLNDPDVGARWKFAVVSVVVALAVVLVWVTAAGLSKKSEAVQRWTYASAVLVAATLFSTIPLLLLDQGDQAWSLAVLAIWLLALFPGFLYLQFRTVRGRTLLEEFVTHLRKLGVDEYGYVPATAAVAAPAARAPEQVQEAHRSAMRNLYVRKFHGVFGAAPAGPNGAAPAAGGKPKVKMRGDTLWPILWVTIFTAVGWSAVLSPDSVFGMRPFGSDFSLANPEGAENALRFGFIGAYFYVVQMLVRRYFQKDLKPDAYLSAMLRLVTVPLLVVVMHTIGFGSAEGTVADAELAVAFFIGVFPQVGMEVIRFAVAKALGRAVPSLKAKYPLSQIDGLNLFYQSRLLEEGIEDMQNLATADFVDLLLQTRIPIGRLVDWIDQTHLYIRMAPKSNDDETETEHPRGVLRRYGVRCATDLEMAFGDADAPAEVTTAVPGLEFVLKTLRQEPNMAHVRSWKQRRAGVDAETATAVEDAAA